MQHSCSISGSSSSQPSGQSRPVVTPFARALAILSSFTPADRWLCNRELAVRAGLPASTVTRLTRTLIALGYLRCDSSSRRFCLNPSALALGYRAAADIEIREAAHDRMRLFADRHQVHVQLSVRNRLDLVVIDGCCTNSIPAALQLEIGSRSGLASSAAGWALLASLPDAERDFLFKSAELHRSSDTTETWKHVRRRSADAIGQVRESGFCVALGESGRPMTMVSAPVRLPGEAPLAVSCMGPSMLLGRARSTRELGPALVRMAGEITLSSRLP